MTHPDHQAPVQGAAEASAPPSGAAAAIQLARLHQPEGIEHAQLVEANNLFQAIYDQGLFAGRLDLAGNVLDVNRSSLEQCGLRREDVIGKPFWECGWWNRSPDVQSWVKAAVERAIRGKPFRGVSTYFWADGTSRVVDFACMPITDDAGNVQMVVPTGMDITERVGSIRNMHAMDILESITEGFFGLDREWRVTYLNNEAQRILGRTLNELVGKVIWDVYPQLAGSEFERVYRRAMTDHEAGQRGCLLPGPRPVVRGASVSRHGRRFRVLPRRHRAEARGSRARATHRGVGARAAHLRSGVVDTPDLVYVFDLEHHFIYANAALLRTWGRTREDALGKTCLELGYEPWHAAMHDREIEQVVATLQPIRGEVPFTGTNGRRIYDYIFVPVVGPDGAIVAVAGTTRDVTERQHNEQAIREQAQRLREADHAKDEFLATLSHELRNPLAPLRNSLALLRLARNSDAITTPIHEMMERQVNHLVRLVDDLLETSRISRGTFVLRKERVEVAAIVRNAVETSEPLIQAGKHELRVSLPDEPLWVEGDPVRLAQIIANLLNNAAKYTDDGGHIAVQVRRVEGDVAISVIDDGVGILPDQLPRMFEMFSRGERASGRAQGGLGIGLALARRLAEMHGGRLDAHSDGPARAASSPSACRLLRVRHRMRKWMATCTWRFRKSGSSWSTTTATPATASA